jgi:hypothetical protein
MTLVLIGAALWALGRGARAASGAGDGLAAKYFSNPVWKSPPALASVDRDISADQMRRRWNNHVPDQFSVRWTGYLGVPRSGVYVFSLRSDDGADLLIDGQLVLDNRGMHSARTRTVRMQLSRGAHAVQLDYTQFAAAMVLQWTWSAEGAAASVVPPYALSRRPAGVGAVLAARLFDDLAAVAVAVLVLGLAWWALVDVPRAAAAVAGAVRRQGGSPQGVAVSAALVAVFLLLPRPGGEIEAIPGSVLEMVAVLDRRGLATYRLSASIVANNWVYQQMIATAWPRTLEPHARALFILPGEGVPPNCTLTDKEEDVSLVSCP